MELAQYSPVPHLQRCRQAHRADLGFLASGRIWVPLLQRRQVPQERDRPEVQKGASLVQLRAQACLEMAHLAVLQAKPVLESQAASLAQLPVHWAASSEDKALAQSLVTLQVTSRQHKGLAVIYLGRAQGVSFSAMVKARQMGKAIFLGRAQVAAFLVVRDIAQVEAISLARVLVVVSLARARVLVAVSSGRLLVAVLSSARAPEAVFLAPALVPRAWHRALQAIACLFLGREAHQSVHPNSNLPRTHKLQHFSLVRQVSRAQAAVQSSVRVLLPASLVSRRHRLAKQLQAAVVACLVLVQVAAFLGKVRVETCSGSLRVLPHLDKAVEAAFLGKRRLAKALAESLASRSKEWHLLARILVVAYLGNHLQGVAVSQLLPLGKVLAVVCLAVVVDHLIPRPHQRQVAASSGRPRSHRRVEAASVAQPVVGSAQ